MADLEGMAELGRFADGVSLWSRMIALAAPDMRPQVFRNCITEGADFVRNGADRTLIIDELIERAERHDLVNSLGGLEVVERTIIDALDAPRTNGSVDDFPLAPPDAPPTDAPPTDAPPARQLRYLDIVHLVRPAPARRWVVQNLVPMANVTLLSGDGGVGKTLLAQQLAVATVLGRDWLGMMPTPGPVMLVSAEDDAAEIHFRLDRIASHYGAGFDELADLHIVTLVGEESALAITTPSGLIKPTALFEAVAREAERIKPVWIGFDTAADMFVVEERDRSQARQCVNLLRGLAVRVDCAALLLSHPSRAGMREGDGQSGSTAWNNSVRSRLYLYRPEEGEAEADVRVLETMKANYSAHGDKLQLSWKDGLLALAPGQIMPATSYDRATADRATNGVFKQLLEFHNNNDIPVSPATTARNFAPSVFAKLPEATPLHSSYRVRMRMFRDAMHAMLKSGEVKTGQGPIAQKPSKRNACIYVARLHPDADPEPKLF